MLASPVEPTSASRFENGLFFKAQDAQNDANGGVW